MPAQGRSGAWSVPSYPLAPRRPGCHAEKPLCYLHAMPAKTITLREYLAALPADRRPAIEALRKVIKRNIGKEFKEGIQYGAIGYFLPHSVYPNGYHCDPSQPLPFAGIACQKNHIGIYLFCVYTTPGEPDRFREEWLATGKKLDMGKSCVRVKKLDDIALEVVGRAIKRMTAKKFIASYEAGLSDAVKQKIARKAGGKKKAAAKKPAAKKPAPKKKAAKKKAVKKATSKR